MDYLTSLERIKYLKPADLVDQIDIVYFWTQIYFSIWMFILTLIAPIRQYIL